MFSHEKLSVYQKALAFVADAERLTAGWGTTHAFVDHLSRASESTLLNIAEGVRTHKPSQKLVAVDYALGSTLECAACMDIAQIKNLLEMQAHHTHKNRLAEIARMLIGLRDSWERSQVREEQEAYRVESSMHETAVFHHERLEAYRTALEIMRWYVSSGKITRLPGRILRELDKALTSLILNIAEGNGRFSRLDQRRFLRIAEASAVKAAAYLDIGVQQGAFDTGDITNPKQLLNQTANMIAGMASRATT